MELSPASVISKLSLLTIHYPDLTLIWSRNPENSAKILKELCQGTVNPDLDKIKNTGKLAGGDEAMQIDDEDEFGKFMPYEFLKKLPGINTNNIKKIAANVKNIQELVSL